MLAFGALQHILTVVMFSGMACLPVMVLLGVIVLPPWPSGWLFRWLGIRPLSSSQRLLRWLLGGACVWAVTLGFAALCLAGVFSLAGVFAAPAGHGYLGSQLSVFPIAVFAAGHVALGLAFFLSAPRAAAARSDKSAWLRPMTAALVLVLLVTVLYSVLVASYIGGIRNAAKMSDARACKMRMDGIWRGISLYRSENNMPPPDFQALIKHGSITERYLQCPAGDPSLACHYFYFPSSAEVDAPAGALVVCELEANHTGQKRHVLCNDTSDIRALGPQEFAAELAKPVNAAFAAAFRAAGGKD